jgi:hypothetical protein
MSQNTTYATNTLKTITTTCGGIGSWLKNALSNAGPGSGSIQSLPPYSTSSSPSPFAFPGILSQKGGARRAKSRRRTKRRAKRRAKHTRKH